MTTRMRFTDHPSRLAPSKRQVRDDGDMYERTLVWESDPDQQGITYDVVRDENSKIFVYEIKPTQTTDCGCGDRTIDARSAMQRLNERNRQFWSKDSGTPLVQRTVIDPHGTAAINARNAEFWGRR